MGNLFREGGLLVHPPQTQRHVRLSQALSLARIQHTWFETSVIVPPVAGHQAPTSLVIDFWLADFYQHYIIKRD